MIFIKQLLWALVPLAWALLKCFLSFAFFVEVAGVHISVYISYAMLALVVLVVLTALFFKILEYARQHYTAYFFGHAMPLPPWWLFVAITTVGVLALIIINDSIKSPILNGLLFGVCVSAIIEELCARVLFVHYRMGTMRLILLNVMSSLAIIFIHAGFGESHMPLSYSLYTKLYIYGHHFIFSFMLGLVAYKTRRIELCIIIHMFSNFIRYVLPTLICCYLGGLNSWCGFLCLFFLKPGVILVTFLLIAGCSYKFINDKTQPT